jgi:GPH family glycoside/pentoside/hexuronide:cation symporter
MENVSAPSQAPASGVAEKRRLPKILKFFWGVGDFGDNFNGTVNGLYGTYFITDVARMPLPLFSVFTMVMSVVGVILGPIGGMLIDKVKPMRWGKYRSWFLVLPPLAAFLGIIRFIVWPNPYLMLMVLLAAGVIGGATGIVPNTAGFSLIPSMCAYEDEKAALSSNRIAYAAIGRLVSGFLVPTLMLPLSTMMGNASYVAIAAAGGLVLIAGYLYQFKLSKGYEGNGMPEEKKAFTFKQIWQAVVSNPHLIPVLFADMTSTLSTFFLPSLLVYMYMYVIQDLSLLATHNVVCSVMAFLGAYLSRYIMQTVEDRRRVAGIIYLCAAAACFSTRFLVGVPLLFIAVSSLMDFASYCAQPIEGTFYFDCAVYTQWKTGGSNPTALFIGVSTLVLQFIGLLRGFIITILFNVINYTPDMGSTPLVRSAFTNVYSLVNCIIPLMGFISITFFYKLSPAIIKKCREEIIARGQAIPSEG